MGKVDREEGGEEGDVRVRVYCIERRIKEKGKKRIFYLVFHGHLIIKNVYLKSLQNV